MRGKSYRRRPEGRRYGWGWLIIMAGIGRVH